MTSRGQAQCKVCGYRCNDVITLLQHVSTKHPDASGPPLDPPYIPTPDVTDQPT